ncbi:MAG: L-threonylcarbamoyladenylate synthase [Verrucomicrobiae bacterium]|nr:L-threonylcarbamoyladenylate synthase [Verrucomicrobiae bacterium]
MTSAHQTTPIFVLPGQSENALREAAAVLKNGGVLLFPTESVYGVGVLACHAAAQNRLRDLKGRPDGKPFQWLTHSIENIRNLSTGWNETAERLARAFWPGPMTLIVKTGNQAAGWRIPRHPWLLQLLENLGRPLASSSANLSGEPSPQNFIDALRPFQGRIDLAIDGGPADCGIASTVVLLAGDTPLRILREGAIPAATILQTATR